jgi:gliding motility-associated-like protein
VQGEDVLTLTGNHPNIVATWSANEGKLSFEGVAGAQISYTDVIAAVLDVVFQSSSVNVSGDKFFSFTIGDVNYLPSTGHYYEYVPSPGITWTAAKNVAETYTYYGLQGYLATITSDDEAQLSGEQAAGTGWIGGSDEETEGVWKWMSGPEAGTVFWNGGPTGSTPNYANWNTNEPNNQGNEDYAHVTAPNVGIVGSWNDLPNTGDTDPNSDYHPQGFIVEYGGMPGDPVVDISASTQIHVSYLTTVSGAGRCASGQVTLEATTSAGTVLWFDAQTGGTQVGSGLTFTTPVLNSTTNYYALSSVNGCDEGVREQVIATILEIPDLQSNTILKNCDEDGVPDGFTDFNLTEVEDLVISGDTSNVTITYHSTQTEADSGNNPINASPYNNIDGNFVYLRVEANNGCYKTCEIELQVSTTSFPNNYLQTITLCDYDGVNDGFFEFDLTQTSQQFLDQFPTGQNLSVHYYSMLEDAQLEQNEITNTSNYINQTAYLEHLFVRVESDDNGDCYGVGQHLDLIVEPKPEFEVEQSDIFCFDGGSILLETFNPNGNFTYQWTDQDGNVIGAAPQIMTSTAGQFTVVASSGTCTSDPVVFNVVESAVADINLDDITVTDLSDNNTIIINNENNNLGIGNYEFALDDIDGPYQTEPVFTNVAAGTHMLYVRDQNGCGIVSLDVFVLGFPKFFSPNNDGVNDMWNILGWGNSFSSQSKIYIFDRYGKLIKELNPNAYGWDGTFKGYKLPTDDFWFVAELVGFDGKTKTLRGHFSLVR